VHLHAEQRFPAAPDEVAAMLADPAFVRGWCEATHASGVTVSIDGAPPNPFTVSTIRAYPTDGFPSFARRFVGDALEISQTDHWSAVGDGTWAGESDVATTGLPARMQARVSLVPDGDMTRQVVDGDLKASIPLVGAKVESLMSDAITGALAVMEGVGRDWLMR
jgi:uncharacterized protein DUF2505